MRVESFSLLCIVPMILSAACVGPTGSAGQTGVRFDISRLNEEGLQGPPDGLTALHYEYCIPDRPDIVREVSAIDPTLEIHRGSPGRIGCDGDELLCLGHTRQTRFREVLQELDGHPEIHEIREAFFE